MTMSNQYPGYGQQAAQPQFPPQMPGAAYAPQPLPGASYAPQPQYAGLPVQSTSPPPQHNPNPFGGSEAVDAPITVGPMIIAYPKLFVPELFVSKNDPAPQPGAKPRKPQYSCELRILKDDPQFYNVYQQLFDAANAVSIAAFKIPADSPQHRNPAIRDMASKKGDHPPGIFLTAKTSQKPGVVKGDPPVFVIDEEEVYGGCIVFANIKPAAYEEDRARGVKWFLNSIWKVADGPRLAAERDPIAAFQHLVGKVPINLQPTQQQMPPQFPQHMPQQGYAQMPQQMPPQYAPQQQMVPHQQMPQGYAQMPQQMPPQYPQQQMPGQMPGLPY